MSDLEVLIKMISGWLQETLTPGDYDLEVESSLDNPAQTCVLRVSSKLSGRADARLFCLDGRWATLGFGEDAALEFDLAQEADRRYIFAVVQSIVQGRLTERVSRRADEIVFSTATLAPRSAVQETAMLEGTSADGTIVSESHHARTTPTDEVTEVAYQPYSSTDPA